MVNIATFVGGMTALFSMIILLWVRLSTQIEEKNAKSVGQIFNECATKHELQSLLKQVNSQTTDVLAQLLSEGYDNWKARCPKCQVPILGSPKFCRACGSPFFESLPSPRLLAFRENSAARAEIDWQCPKCHRQVNEEIEIEMEESEHDFIHILECRLMQNGNICGTVGEIEVIPRRFPDEKWVGRVCKHGELRMQAGEIV